MLLLLVAVAAGKQHTQTISLVAVEQEDMLQAHKHLMLKLHILSLLAREGH
jgi:hypothetical protein